MTGHIISDTATLLHTTPDAAPAAPAATLDAFWTEYRLLHKKDALREYLGTETLEDLADVHPGDLNTLRARQWAQATLSVAEANRLARAVADYQAARPPPPEYGPQWYPSQGGLPGDASNVCQNNV